MNPPEYQSVIDFWFVEIEPRRWFQSDAGFDALLLQRFGTTHARALAGELYEWRTCALGRLAEIIVLDQFSRNLFRGTARAFAADAQALVLAQEAIANQSHTELNTAQQAFLFMPFMHSESLLMHELAVKLFSAPGLENNLAFEHRHREIIERFGRYPHRNAALGRPSTADEIEFLKQPGSAF